MLIKKVLETTIDLLDVNDIYTPNVQSMLMRKLKERYNGRCFSSMLITDIVDIVRYSDRKLVDNRLDGAAYIDVEFVAEGIIFVKNEVINGCKATKVSTSGVLVQNAITNGMIIAGSDKRTAEMIRVIRKDQTIPVVVDDVCYNIYKPQIAMRCLPYVPIPCKTVYYNITELLSDADSAKISKLLDHLADEQKMHQPMQAAKSYEFFKNLVYPYKTVQKPELSPISSKFTPVDCELKQIQSIREDQCLMYVETASLDGKFLYLNKTKLADPTATILSSPLYPALSEIIALRIRYLTTLRGLAEQYDTPEKNHDMLAYWKLCTVLKE